MSRDRRKIFYMTFLFKVCRGGVDSRMLEIFNVHVPERVNRSNPMFRLHMFRIVLFDYLYLNRLQAMFNELARLNNSLNIKFNS